MMRSFFTAMDAVDVNNLDEEDEGELHALLSEHIQLKLFRPPLTLPTVHQPDFNISIPRSASPTSAVSVNITSYIDAPTVSTPGDQTLRLPPPPSIRQRVLRETYAPEIASPVDTPSRRSSYHEGSAKRGDPATPIALGQKLLNNPQYKTISTIFQAFEKGVLKDNSGKKATKIFDGCRICLPADPRIAHRLHQDRWKLIVQLGGKVTIQPDTAVTHVIYDGSSASELAGSLGLGSLSELAEGTVCVKYSWITQSRLESRRLDPMHWLSFRPSLSKTRTMSKLRDTTRKREHTASDSETESPNRQRPPPPAQSRSSPAKLIAAADNRTVHDVPAGPGWVDSSNRDALDEMISGVQSGEVRDDSEDEVGDGNPNSTADHFKCGQSHDGSAKGGPNAWLASKFEEMHDLYSGSKLKNDFQLKSYRTAASVISRTKWPIKSGADAVKIRGIGENMRERIDEFLEGRPGRLFYDMDEQMQATQAFAKVYGIGKTQASEFYQKGARTIADLADPSNPFHLNEGQKVGLALYDDLNTRIPRAECKSIYTLVSEEALRIDPKLWIEIMGSYRRGQETSGDVDFLITRDTEDGHNHSKVLVQLVQALTASGFITHELSRPHDWHELESKWMGVCRLGNGLHRRIDILCIPFISWGAALIYFTGNDIFNRSMRLYARKRGYSLNQRGLSEGVIRGKDGLKQTEGVIIASRTEQEIFDKLGLRWRPPHLRRP